MAAADGLAQQPSLYLGQSMNLDFVLDMDLPDLQEFVPVDTFFDSYVSGLQNEAQDAVADQNPFGNGVAPAFGNGMHSDSLRLNNSAALDGSGGSGAHLNGLTGLDASVGAQPMVLGEQPMLYANGAAAPAGGGGGANGLVAPIITTGDTMVPNPGMDSAAADMPPIPAPGKRGRPKGSGRGGGRSGVARSNSGGSDDATLLHSTEHSRGDKTKRNPKQQLQNKQAQQRYRERRKQRFTELESALDQLSDQVQGGRAENQALTDQNNALQGKTSQLEALLAAKEAELAALRDQLSQSNASSSGLLGSGDLAAEEGAGDSTLTGSGFGGSGKLSDAIVAECRSEFAAHVATLRAFIEEHNLRNLSAQGEGVPAELLQRTQDLVAAGCAQCQRAVRAGGVKVLDLMAKDLEHMGQMTCDVKKARWVRILDALRLSRPQQDALLLLRKQHLKKLHDVYEQRQHLNMQAMGLMLPHPSKSDTEGTLGGRNPSLEGKMACMSVAGYAACAKSNVALDAVLDEIKENLRLEQKTVMEMNYLVMNRVLSPIQSALFVVEAYPTRPDALALSNIAAQALGRDADAGCPKAAEILAEQNAAEVQGAKGVNANGLQSVSVAASSGPGKAGMEHRALHRMDSPEAEGGTSGDSHCSEFIMH